MFAFFKNRKIRKEQERQEELAAENECLESLKRSIDCLEKAMLNAPCAMNNMHNCTSECVHFEKGYVYQMPDFNGGVWNVPENPKCKLWAAR